MLKYLYVLFVAMLPVLELRGALPLAVALGIPLPLAVLLAVAGNILPLAFIYLWGLKFLYFLKSLPLTSKIAHFILERGRKAGEELEKKSKNGHFIALWLFVAIPLPGTGAWTGMLAATLLQLKFKESFLACVLGVLTAALIMCSFLQFFV